MLQRRPFPSKAGKFREVSQRVAAAERDAERAASALTRELDALRAEVPLLRLRWREDFPARFAIPPRVRTRLNNIELGSV